MRPSWARMGRNLIALSLMLVSPAVGQPQEFGPRDALLEKARNGFDTYMLGDEFEGARLARVQKDVFPDSWSRLRNRFAEASVDKLQGKVGPEETQRRYLAIIGESFVEVETAIVSNRRSLGLAPHPALVAWEHALNDQLRAHLAVDPETCNLLDMLRRPASPKDVGTKVDLIIAYWKAFGAGTASPVDREFEQALPADAAALTKSLPSADRRAILSRDGSLNDLGSLSCSARLSFSNALLAMSGEAQNRLIAHSITRTVK